MTLSFAQLFTRKKTRLSLVPLIDVVFILLLFFLLSTQLNVLHDVDVEFPISIETEELPEIHVLTLENNRGDFTYGGSSYLPNDFSALPRGSAHDQDAFVIESSPLVNVQGLIRFVDGLHNVGITNISLFDDQ